MKQSMSCKGFISGKLHGCAAVARFLCALALLSCFINPSLSLAAEIADEPCDTNFRTAMNAKAWMEAQREITQNQNRIMKPDSVLEYTCFNQFLDDLASAEEDGDDPTGFFQLFTRNERWDEVPPGLGEISEDGPSIERVLEDLVLPPLDRYQNGNFPHRFYSGQSSLDHNIPGSISTSPAMTIPSYTCNRMNEIWEFAKCRSFISDSDEEAFYTFSRYVSDPDKRYTWRNRCAADTRWATARTTAITTPPWIDDPVATYFVNMDPGTCGNDDYPPIPTGLRVRTFASEPNVYNEHVCLLPGCHYLPSGLNSGNCVPAHPY